MAMLTWLSLAYAGLLAVGLFVLVVTMLRLMWLIGGSVRDVDRTRRSIAAHTAPLGDQVRTVRAAAKSAAEHLASAAARIRRVRSTVENAG
jgi:hypothetical protein